jgi:hypothetical protein
VVHQGIFPLAHSIHNSSEIPIKYFSLLEKVVAMAKRKRVYKAITVERAKVAVAKFRAKKRTARKADRAKTQS